MVRNPAAADFCLPSRSPRASRFKFFRTSPCLRASVANKPPATTWNADERAELGSLAAPQRAIAHVPVPPMRRHELGPAGLALVGVSSRQVLPGDVEARRDHRPQAGGPRAMGGARS